MVNTKNIQRVPKLRFPEFKDDWTVRKIGDFVEERKEAAGQDLPLYSLTIENGIVPKSKRYERSFLVKGNGDAYKEMLPGDFAFNPMNLRFGALAMHKGDFNVAVSKYYNIFYCNTEGSPEYLESYFTCYNMINYYNRMSTGTLEEKKRVHYLDFIHFKKPFPALPEQEKIASFLSAVDKKIQQLMAKKELLEQYKKGVMQKTFSQEIRFTDDNGKDYPDWEEKQLGDVLNTIPTKTYQIKSSEILTNGILPVIDQGRKRIAGYSNENNKVFKNKGIIVYGDHTTILKYIDFDFIIGADGTKLLTTEGEDLKYLYYNLMYNNIEPEGYKRHFSILKKIYLQIPCVDEQQKIACFLQSIDQKIESVQSKLTQTQTFKKGLLQQLFV